MSQEEAIKIVSDVCSQAVANWETHQRIQTALGIINKILAEKKIETTPPSQDPSV